MDVQPVVQTAMLQQDLEAALDECLTQITASVNRAAPGRMISDSEEITRTALHKFGEAAFQAALQRKINAAEAAFSPSTGPQDRQAWQEPRPAATDGDDGQRGGQAASTLVECGVRQFRPGG